MKKLSVLGMLILVAMFSFTAKADIITLDGANEIANAFFANSATSQKKQMKSITQLEYAWDSNSLTQKGSSMMKSVDEDPTFYVFNNPDGEGFVIVSGDDNARSVIGYSYEGNIPAADEIPAPMQDYLLGIDEEIKWARTNLTSSNKNLKSAEVPDGGNIVKYIETALWNQHSPFNKLCPNSSLTGCVPTAFAIVMRHHQWPAKGKVATLPTSDSPTVDLSSHTYDWSKMPMSYSSYTTEQADAVAQIMYDLGVSMGATYGSSVTDVNVTTNIGRLFCQNFDYLGEDMCQREVSYVGNDEGWIAKIKSSINAGCPIPYTGARVISGGESTLHGVHMFVLDGYTDNDYYHFNWAFGDDTNGWYTLTTMGPEGYQYIQSHKAFFNLRPNSTTYSVTATATPSNMGTVSVNMGTAGSTATAEMYNGATATLTAYPADGYALASWTKNGVVVGSRNTIEVKVGTSENDYVANFDLASNVLVVKDYILNPSTVGFTGSSKVGVVTYQTSEEYPAALSLASTKTDGTSLNSISKYNDEEFRMYAYDQVSATSSIKYTLSVPEGYIITEYSFEYYLNSTSYPCSISCNSVTTQATENAWHSLSPVVVNAKTAEFTLTAEKANASSNLYVRNLIVSVAKEGGVTPPSGETVGIELYVSSFEDLDEVELNNNCTVSSNVSTAVVGSQVVLTATTNPGYKFDGWSLDAATFISTDKSYSLTITSDMVFNGTVSVFAAFSKDNTPVTPTQYTVTVSTNGTGGTATVNGGQTATVDAGSTVTILATPAQGYVFDYWTVNGEQNSLLSAKETPTVNSDLTLVANFVADEPSTPKTLSAISVFSKGENNSTHYRIPALVELENGTLVAIADKRGDAINDLPNTISIVAKTSTNKGETWSDMVTVAQGNATEGTSFGDAAAVYDAEAKKIVAVFVGFKNYGTNGGVSLWSSTSSKLMRLYQSESIDGKTWTTPKDITEQVYSGVYQSGKLGTTRYGLFAGSGSAVQLKQGTNKGRLMFVVAAREDGSTDGSGEMSNFAVYSDNHGESWNVSSIACGNGDEAKVVELSDGKLLMSIKNRSKGYRLMAKSNDQGVTWESFTPTTKVLDPACNGDVVSTTYGGKYYLLHSIPANSTTRRDVSIYISEDDGTNWTLAKQVFNSYSAYSSLEVLNDGTVGIIVEEGKWDSGISGEDVFNLKYYSYTMDQLLPETPEEPETPIEDKALELDGTRYMSIPNDAAFSIAGGGSYTITFKVKIPQFKSGANMRFVNNRAYEGTANSGTTGFDIYGGNSSTQAVSVNLSYDGKPWGNSFAWNTGLTQDTWAHISWVLDGTTTYLYVDGVLKETKTGMSTLGMPSKANILVGAGYTNTDGSAVQPSFFTTGSIDNVRFYNKALSASEISADMTSTVNSSTANLVAAYDFNNVQGLSVEDISGNGHTGTLVGFPEPDVQYTASVKAGNGGTANVDGTNEVTVNSGTEVTYTATANDGYRFTGWSNGTTTVSTVNPYTFAVTSDIELTANFSDGVQITSVIASTNFGTYSEGNTVYSIDNIKDNSLTTKFWSNAEQAVDRYVMLDLGSYYNISDIELYFDSGDQPAAATVEISIDNSSWTPVSSFVMNDIKLIEQYIGLYSCNASNAIARYVRMRITTPTSRSWFQMHEFKVYGKPAYAISANATEGGTATVSATVVGAGESVTFTATPSTGYNFAGWYNGENKESEDAEYTVTNITSDIELTAKFEKQTFTVTVTAGAGGSVNSITNPVEYGTSLELTATPAEGYKFTGWSDDSTENPYTVTVTENISLVANFEEIPTYTVNVSVNGNGSVEKSAGSVLEGNTVTLTATPAEGYKFTGWYQGEELISKSNPYTVTVTGAIEYVAKFEESSDKLLLSFACLSDLHAQQDFISDANNIRLRESATKTLEAIKEQENVDLIVLGGDYTSNTYIPKESWEKTRQLLIEETRKAFNGTKTPVIYVNGNHEYEVAYPNIANSDGTPKQYNAGEYYGTPMKTDIGALATDDCFYETAINGTGEAFELLAAYHYVVNGFDFVVLNAGQDFFTSASDYSYSIESVNWCATKLEQIYASDPTKTVFFLVHIPFSDSKGISNVNKGMNKGVDAEFVTKLKTTLAKYPNLIMLYGHDHGTDSAYIRSATDERVTEYATDGSVYTGEGSANSLYYIQNFNTGDYLGFNAWNLATTDSPTETTITLVENTTDKFYVNLSNETTTDTDGYPINYLYCGTSGRFSGNNSPKPQGVETGTNIMLFEVSNPASTTITATQVTSITAGKTYLFVGLKDGNYYALSDEMYKFQESKSQRMVGAAVTITDGTITYTPGTASVLWTINKKPSATEKSFFSSFMGSMRYYENSFEDGQLADRRIIQALMVYVYSDRVELKMKNYGEGDVTANGITVNEDLDSYVSERIVTHSAEQVTATPVITSTGGDVAPNTEVTVTVDAPEWHNLYYTTDGTEPTEKSAKVDEGREFTFTPSTTGEVTVKVAAQEGIRLISASTSVTYQVVEPPVRTVKIASNDKNLGFAGYVSPQPEGTATDVTTSEPVTVMAYLQPDANSRFVNWTINGEEVGTNPDAFTYTGAEDATIQANFELKPLSFEVSATASPVEGGRVELFVGTSAPATSLTVEENTRVTFSATANDGYRFVRWSKGGQLVSNEPSYTTPITSATALVAEFELKTTYNVVVTGGTANGSANSEIEKGTEVTFTAIVPDGQEFVNWTDAEGNIVSTDETFTIKVVGEINITANFREVQGGGGEVEGDQTLPSGYPNLTQRMNESCTTSAPTNIHSHSLQGITISVGGEQVLTQGATTQTFNYLQDSKKFSVSKGQDIDITFINGNWNKNVWIGFDWNRDGDFEDVRAVYGANGRTDGGTQSTGNITITVPQNAVLGCSRIRLLADGVDCSQNWNESEPMKGTHGTGIIGYAGSVHDFTINVKGAATPAPSRTISAIANFADGSAGTVTVNGKSGSDTAEGTITLVATPASNSQFVNWTLNGTEVATNATITDNSEGSKLYVANFKKTLTITDAYASSQEASGEGVGNGITNCLFDKNETNFWHSKWQGGEAGYPHWFMVKLDAPQMIDAFNYVSRGTGSNTDGENNGNIVNYQLYISESYIEASSLPTAVKTGTFSYSGSRYHNVTLDKPVYGQYVMLYATGPSANGKVNASCSEFYLYASDDYKTQVDLTKVSGTDATVKVTTDAPATITVGTSTYTTTAENLTVEISTQSNNINIVAFGGNITNVDLGANVAPQSFPETVTEITLRNTRVDEVTVNAPALNKVTVVSDVDNNVAKVSTASDLSQGVQVVVEKEIKTPCFVEGKGTPTIYNFLSMPFAFNTSSIKYWDGDSWKAVTLETQIRVLMYNSAKRANGSYSNTWEILKADKDIAANQGFVVIGNNDLGETVKLQFTSAEKAYNGSVESVVAKPYRHDSEKTSENDADWNFNGVPYLTSGVISGYTLYFHTGYAYNSVVPAIAAETSISAYQGVMYQAEVTNNISKYIPVETASVARNTNASEDVFARAYISVDDTNPAKIILSDESSENFVVNEDAWYLAPTANTEAAAYFNVGGAEASVSVQPAASELPMTVYTGAGTQHRITLTATDGNYDVYLKDAVTNEVVCLNDEDYNFTAAAKTTIANRFTVSMVEPTGIIDAARAEGTIKAVVTANGIKLFGTEEGDEVTLYNANGMIITNATAEDGVTTIATSATGVIIIKVADQTVKVVK